MFQRREKGVETINAFWKQIALGRLGETEECVSKVDHLLTHEEERLALGEAGREHVRLNFLLPRLLRDELKLVRGLLSGTTVSPRVSDQAWAA